MSKVRNISDSVGSQRVLLETRTMSGNSVEDFILDTSTYTIFKFEFINIIPDTDNSSFLSLLSRDGGSTFDTTNFYERFYVTYEGALTPSQGTASNHNLASAVGNAASEYGVTGQLEIFGAGESKFTKMISLVQSTDNSGNHDGRLMATEHKSSNVTDAIRFYYSIGNVATGTIRFWGYP